MARRERYFPFGPVVGEEGFEPPTPWFVATRSNPLSYRPHPVSTGSDLPYSIVTAVEFNHQVRDGLDASAAYITALPLDTYRNDKNGSSRRDLLLNSQNFCRSIPAGAESPSLSRLCYRYRKLGGSRNRRALILGWAYYLDAFSSYPLRTWLPSVYRGHDNWYTRGASFPVLSY
ncbi:hypothetical protein M569_00237 [Genlisea aurea]|uniref:Uncharacterized protein n=1 Tax=Genlisea aurea TaxID=192259 RepID=S8D527_9LAMI|nr:hypothetical protein M569_00237 [Genlisea aurea]